MERQTNGIEITTDRIGNKMKEYDEKTKMLEQFSSSFFFDWYVFYNPALVP